MTVKPIFACDPGINGAIAMTDGSMSEAVALEDRDGCRRLIEQGANAGACAYIEEVGGYIGKDQPGSRMFTFGHAAGFPEGLFFMAHIPITMVRPQVWIREVLPGSLRLEYEQRKRALKAYAQSLHPGIKVTLKTGDALALLEYAKRRESGAKPAPVVKSTGNYAQDGKEAAKWAKAQGYALPKKGSGEWREMINYFCQHIK